MGIEIEDQALIKEALLSEADRRNKLATKLIDPDQADFVANDSEIIHLQRTAIRLQRLAEKAEYEPLMPTDAELSQWRIVKNGDLMPSPQDEEFVQVPQADLDRPGEMVKEEAKKVSTKRAKSKKRAAPRVKRDELGPPPEDGIEEIIG